MVQWLCDRRPVGYHFGAAGKKCPDGCAHYSANEWLPMEATRVEPWNTLYPTPVFQGEGFFYTFSPKPPLEGRCPAGAVGCHTPLSHG